MYEKMGDKVTTNNNTNTTTNNNNNSFAKYFVVQLAMWWFFSSLYSIEVKKFLLVYPELPLEASFVSLFLTVICTIAFLRRDEVPNQNIYSFQSFRELFLPSLLHLIGTVSTNYSISLMAISFTHIVKAVEPVFTIVWSLLLASRGVAKFDDLGYEKIAIVGLIIVGVIISSISEATFSWSGLAFGMISNLSFSGRNVLFKHSISATKIGKDSLYLILNVFGTIISLILVLVVGGFRILDVDSYSYSCLFYSGLSYFLYTTISIRILEGVSPITHAISNTCKRFVVVFVSTFYFSKVFTLMSTFGASLTIGGVAMYTLADQNKKRNSKIVRMTGFFVFIFVMAALIFGLQTTNQSQPTVDIYKPSKVLQTLPISLNDVYNISKHPIITHYTPPSSNNKPSVTIPQTEVTIPHSEVTIPQIEGTLPQTEVTISQTEGKIPHTEVIKILQARIMKELLPEFKGKTEVAILCHPNYRNRGDSALYVGQAIFVNQLGLKLIYECTCGGAFLCDINKIKQLNPQTGIVAHHGGGNFGDIWPELDFQRRKFITQLPQYKHIVFPQSIWYSNITKSKITSEMYAKSNLTLCARDVRSYQLLENYFSKTRRLLVPDMAFMIGAVERQPPVVDIFWLLRIDKESVLPQMRINKLMDLLPSKFRGQITMSYGDWEQRDVPGLQGTLTNRALMRFNDACRILSQGRVIISDRLHGHIISTLLGIPHVMLDNHYGKTKSYHTEWTSNLEKVDSATTLIEALQKAIVLLGVEKNTTFAWD